MSGITARSTSRVSTHSKPCHGSRSAANSASMTGRSMLPNTIETRNPLYSLVPRLSVCGNGIFYQGDQYSNDGALVNGSASVQLYRTGKHRTVGPETCTAHFLHSARRQKRYEVQQTQSARSADTCDRGCRKPQVQVCERGYSTRHLLAQLCTSQLRRSLEIPTLL